MRRKEIAKNNVLYFVTAEDLVLRDGVLAVIGQLTTMEVAEHAFDADIAAVEKQIKEAKLKPTTEGIRASIEELRLQMSQLNDEILSIKQQSNYLGESAVSTNIRTTRKLNQVIESFRRRRDGCIDMVSVLSEQLNETKEAILTRAGIDAEEFNCVEALQILDIPLEEKKESSFVEEEVLPDCPPEDGLYIDNDT